VEAEKVGLELLEMTDGPANNKLLWRLGLVYMGNKDYEKAIPFLQRGTELYPESPEFARELQLAQQKSRTRKATKKSRFSKIFDSKVWEAEEQREEEERIQREIQRQKKEKLA
jgi:tetratricopeptide (TPR) repeat protein